jgi:putative transposase
MQYRSTPKAVFSVKYHVIWCPKYHRGVLGGAAELRLKQIIGEVVAESAAW